MKAPPKHSAVWMLARHPELLRRLSRRQIEKYLGKPYSNLKEKPHVPQK